MRHPGLAEIVRRDPRYDYHAYEFVYVALRHTQELLGKVPKKEGAETPQSHVSGREILDGIRDLAHREYGLMARAVFRHWGIDKTDDFGEIVYNLIDAGLMSRTDQDSKADFHNVYDFDEALVRRYQFQVEKTE